MSREPIFGVDFKLAGWFILTAAGLAAAVALLVAFNFH